MKYFLLLGVALLLLNPHTAGAQIRFQDVSKAAGINMIPIPTDEVAGGVVVLDYDKDGWEDLYCAGGQGYDALYHNNHDGTFTDVSVQAGIHDHGRIFSHGAASLDFDQDGWPDLYIACEGHDLLFRNNHDGTFTDVTKKAGILDPTGRNNNMSVTFGDFDGDGLNDIYVARYIDTVMPTTTDPITGWPDYQHVGLHNYFYINNGNGTFTESAAEYGIDNKGCGLVALFFDYDRDGDLDLLIGNDFGYYLQPNAVYKNMLVETGTAKFVDVSDAIGMKSKLFCMGIGPSDYDRDGDFDFFETNIGPEMLLQNNGNHFTDVIDSSGAMMGKLTWNGTKYDATTWSPIFVDMDNDGWEDLFEVHGTMPVVKPRETFEYDTTRILQNIGGKFKDITSSAGFVTWERGRGGTTFDYDQDGRMDLVFGPVPLVPVNPTNGIKLLKNITPNAGHWLEIELNGTTCGAEAIGTCIEVWEHGIRHLRQVSTAGSMCSQPSLIQHFGLGASDHADSILIFWPRKPIERYYNVSADQRLSYTEGTQSSVPDSPASVWQPRLYPSIVTDVVHLTDLRPEDQLAIYDMLGRQVYHSRTISTALRISTSGFAAGAYTAVVRTVGSQRVIKFVKE